MADRAGVLTSPAPIVRQDSRIQRFFLRHEWARGYALLSPTLAVMVLAMCLPVFMLAAHSFWTQNYLTIDETFTLANYEQALGWLWGAEGAKPIYIRLLWKSMQISFGVTVTTLILAYPFAYFLAFKVRRNKNLWIILISVPFLTSYLLRVFTWKIILGFNGVINSGLMSLGIISEPLEFLLYNPTAVLIVLAHAWAAFAILPIYVSLEKIDRSLLEAATDLGDGPFRRFWRITWPLSVPGVIASGLLVFIPTVGDYVTPKLVGGTEGIMIGNIIQSQFGKANNWPLGSALSIVMAIAITIVVLIFLYVMSLGRVRAK
ncbi:MAG: ABC transporter permease [Alphaproteobacteria bacterium]|nr:ABC transporter permease [Alphaproteobacteria bacterium]